MSLDQSIQLFHQWSQTALSHLPPEAQNVLLHPVVPKALAVLVGLGVVRQTNRALSQWVANNWQGAGPWQPARELILITGGSSGIGKQVVDDLAPTGVRIVILDIQEPTSKLRKYLLLLSGNEFKLTGLFSGQCHLLQGRHHLLR